MLRKSLSLFTLAIVALPMGLQPVAAQEVDDVLAKHYEAIGGLDAWKALESATMSGTMTMSAMGLQAPITIYAMRPNKSRVEFEFQGMQGIQAFDGETAWQLMPFAGQTSAEPLPADQAKIMAEEADIDGALVGWKEDGHQIELAGTEDVEGTEAYKLVVTLKSGDVRYYFLDAEYYLPIKVVGDRMGAEVVTVFGDYKEVGGLMMPHSIEVSLQGGQVVTFDSIELNSDVNEEIFTMPNG